MHSCYLWQLLNYLNFQAFSGVVKKVLLVEVYWSRFKLRSETSLYWWGLGISASFLFQHSILSHASQPINLSIKKWGQTDCSLNLWSSCLITYRHNSLNCCICCIMLSYKFKHFHYWLLLVYVYINLLVIKLQQRTRYTNTELRPLVLSLQKN